MSVLPLIVLQKCINGGGEALTNVFPEGRSVVQWLRYGWSSAGNDHPKAPFVVVKGDEIIVTSSTGFRAA
jgi:hypothetical protein